MVWTLEVWITVLFIFGLNGWEMICSHTPHPDTLHTTAHIHFNPKKLQ
jgi:hypothetical protein